jgi:adenosylhomocysteine nucleosidase
MTAGTLIVAALEEEADALVRAGHAVHITGPGKTQAAGGLTRALQHAEAITRVVAVGTAAALRPDFPSGVHVLAEVRQHDTTPIDVIVGRPVSPPAVIALSPTGSASCATGDAFIDDPRRAAALAEIADLVDMEAYAYAWAARSFGIPITILKAVSDTAGVDAAQEWKASLPQCAALLRDAVDAVLAGSGRDGSTP